MNDIFNFFSPLSFVKSGTVAYNPLINYDWSTTTTSGLRYLKDVGSTPTYNASMYFGRGAYLNGVDQSIDYGTLDTTSAEVSMVFRGNSVICCHKYNFWTVRNGFQYYLADGLTLVVESILFDSTKTYTLNITPTLIELFENGVKILTKIPKSLLKGGAKTIGTRFTAYTSSIIKDLFMFNRTLTQAEITQSYEQPEAFYAMAQADSTCVLNMPMCETDGYVRNMKSYSEGSELVTVVNGYGKNTVTKTNDVYTITVIDDIKGCFVTIPNVLIGDKVLISYEIISSTATTGNIFSWFGSTKIEPIATFSHINTSTRTSGDTRFEWLNTGAVITFKVSVKKLTGVSFIQNYTPSVRDNAKNLQYGLQTCKFVRDSLGVIQSASDYLVLDKTADGYGYINNLSIPSNLTMEIVFDQSNSNYANYNKLLDWETNFRIERLGSSNSIYGVVGTSNIGSLSVSSTNTAFIVYVLNFTTSTVLRYLNSVFIGENPMPASTLFSAKNLYLGNNRSLSRGIGGVIKLFKVHNKALTKEEITKNYNEYVAKGLLS